MKVPDLKIESPLPASGTDPLAPRGGGNSSASGGAGGEGPDDGTDSESAPKPKKARVSAKPAAARRANVSAAGTPAKEEVCSLCLLPRSLSYTHHTHPQRPHTQLNTRNYSLLRACTRMNSRTPNLPLGERTSRQLALPPRRRYATCVRHTHTHTHHS